MAEGRMLKKRIAKSKKFPALKSHRARMLYLMLFPYTDIKGRMEADPDLIKTQITPRLSLTEKQIMEDLEDMARVGLILLWHTNNDLYLEITRFEDFQSLREDREAASSIGNPTPEQLQEFCGSGDGDIPLKDKISKDKLSKDKYKDCVFLSQNEYEKLLAKYGNEKIEKAINILNNYKMSKGKKYKSDYHAILNWVIGEVEKRHNGVKPRGGVQD